MIRISACVALTIVACSSGTNPFVATWECQTTETITTLLPSQTSSSTSNTTVTMVVSLAGDTRLHAQGAGYTGAACALAFTESATVSTNATLDAGQTCAMSGGNVSYSSGKAAVNGSSLQVDVAYALPADASGGARTGTTSFACAKR